MKVLSKSTLLAISLACATAMSSALLARTSATPAVDQALVDSLLAMPKAERNAQLKAMSPRERRGLWLAVKRAEATAKGAASLVYRNEEGTRIDPAVAKSATLGGKSGDGLAPTAVGTITYDSGFPTIGFGGGALVGNHFDTHTGIPVLASGTVSTIQALVVPGPANTTSSAGFVLLGPQTGGGGATALFSTFTVATGIIDSLSFAGLGVNYTGSDFFVLFGDFASVYVPAFGTGTTLGQGHHGVVGYTGGVGPNITGTFDFGGAQNAFIRTTGNIVPVELMSFDVL